MSDERDSGEWAAPPVPGGGGPGEDFTAAAARGFIGRPQPWPDKGH